MSDDLISRKSVIDLIDKLGYINVGNHDDFKANCRMDKIRQEVYELPTAFDKEKVIEELKANMSSAQGISGQAVTFMFSDGYYNGTKDAIEIVEKGGIE